MIEDKLYLYGHFINNQIRYVGVGYNNNDYLRAKIKHNQQPLWKNVFSGETFEYRILKSGMTFKDVDYFEKWTIDLFGRIDKGTGVLCNKNNGGYGSKIIRKINDYDEYQKEYRKRPEVKEYNKEYHKKPKFKEYQKEWGEKNRQQIKEYQKEYYLKNKEHLTEHQREYYLKNIEYYKDYSKRPEVKEHKKEYLKVYRKKKKERLNK